MWCVFLSYETSRSVSFHLAGLLCLDIGSSADLNGMKLRGSVLATGWLKGFGDGTRSTLGDRRPVVEDSYEADELLGKCSVLEKARDSYFGLVGSSLMLYEPLKLRTWDLLGGAKAFRWVTGDMLGGVRVPREYADSGITCLGWEEVYCWV